MQSRRRFRQAGTLEARLGEEAERLREHAKVLPPGEERASILRKVREIEMTCGMVDWINSPGLQPPS
jgi:hypothetical protein